MPKVEVLKNRLPKSLHAKENAVRDMSSCKVNSMTPFLPANDYELSCRFYRDLGFVEVGKLENATKFEVDGNAFWLQDYYVKDWANNTMLCLYVEDLESWRSRIDELKFDENYEQKACVISKPHQQDGAMMMQIGDPSGVLWHIRQDG